MGEWKGGIWDKPVRRNTNLPNYRLYLVVNKYY